MKEVFEQVTETIKDASEDVTKTMLVTSVEKNTAVAN